MNSKKMILTGVSFVFFVVIAIVWWLLSPTWLPIYPGQVLGSSQNEVVDILNKKGIEYKVDKKTNQLLLRSHDLAKAQSVLSENGLPKEQGSGLEIFNNSDYGLSEFAQTINYQRGMEEELARTLRRMSGIKNARVHLTIKKESLFEDRKQEPKASVVLSLKSGFTLDQEKILGVQEVIAAAIPNLDANKVVIVTDAGHVLAGSEADTSVNRLGSVEQKYTNTVTELLQDIVPAGMFKVSVNVIVDNKKKTTIEENLYPDLNNGKGFLLRKKMSEKSPEANMDGHRGGSQTQSEEEYIYSKEKSEIVYPTGEITKISVGLVISMPIALSEQEAINRLIFESLGMNAERGDRVSIYVKSAVVPNAEQKEGDDNTLISRSGSESFTSAELVLDSRENKFVHYLKSKIFMLFTLCVTLFILSNLFLILWISGKNKAQRQLTEAERKSLVADIKQWIG